ncbi:MAG: 16S rRNA (guanine(966)-N(2))-methyltransferase RsmD [bacterium]
MRIISGTAKGRKLATPLDDRVRPTTDRIRESLFSILGSFEDCTVLDAFAGTGALGCEALSRGATRVCFADNAAASIALVTDNVARVHAEDRAEIIHGSYELALRRMSFDPDVVFLDPPYNQGLTNAALEVLANAPRITAGALVVCEQHADEPPCQHPAFTLDDERLYGSVRLRLFLRNDDE